MSALDSIDTARRDLFIAAEYKGMSSAAESAHALAKAHSAVVALVAAARAARPLLDFASDHPAAEPDFYDVARALDAALAQFGDTR